MPVLPFSRLQNMAICPHPLETTFASSFYFSIHELSLGIIFSNDPVRFKSTILKGTGIIHVRQDAICQKSSSIAKRIKFRLWLKITLRETFQRIECESEFWRSIILQNCPWKECFLEKNVLNFFKFTCHLWIVALC